MLLEEGPLGESDDLREDRDGKALGTKSGERLVARQSRLTSQPGNAPVATLLALDDNKFVQVVHVDPTVDCGPVGEYGVVFNKQP